VKKEYNLNESVNYLTYILHRMMSDKLQSKFYKAKIDTPTNQWLTLVYLHDNNMQNQQILSDALSMNKTAVTRLINEMEDNNYVVRRIQREDRRNNILEITKEGEKAYSNRSKFALDVNELTCEGIPEEDMEVFYRTIHKMIDNLK